MKDPVNTVDERVLENAKRYLREDESRKQQSLAQFREWLSKHPFIIKCSAGEEVF
jgi:hypothetical protein